MAQEVSRVAGHRALFSSARGKHVRMRERSHDAAHVRNDESVLREVCECAHVL